MTAFGWTVPLSVVLLIAASGACLPLGLLADRRKRFDLATFLYAASIAFGAVGFMVAIQ